MDGLIISEARVLIFSLVLFYRIPIVLNCVVIALPILQMRKLSCRKLELFVQDHFNSKLQI